MNRCWYLLGLPTDRLARATAFKQSRTTGDPPFTRARVAGIDNEDYSPTAYDADVEKVSADMRTLETQLHPGMIFHCTALSSTTLTRLTLSKPKSPPSILSHVMTTLLPFPISARQLHLVILQTCLSSYRGVVLIPTFSVIKALYSVPIMRPRQSNWTLSTGSLIILNMSTMSTQQ